MMDEHDPLRSRIQNCTRYKELLQLRDTVWGMSAKLEFATYIDLRKRVDTRVEEFERPSCEDYEIMVVTAEGEPVYIDERECRIVESKGVSLPTYVFSKYEGAEDIEMRPAGVEDEGYDGGRSSYDPKGKGSKRGAFNPRLGILQQRIENVIKLANYMNNTYSQVLPKISTDLNEIVSKLDTLYSKISNNEYELRG